MLPYSPVATDMPFSVFPSTRRDPQSRTEILSRQSGAGEQPGRRPARPAADTFES